MAILIPNLIYSYVFSVGQKWKRNKNTKLFSKTSTEFEFILCLRRKISRWSHGPRKKGKTKQYLWPKNRALFYIFHQFTVKLESIWNAIHSYHYCLHLDIDKRFYSMSVTIRRVSFSMVRWKWHINAENVYHFAVIRQMLTSERTNGWATM